MITFFLVVFFLMGVVKCQMVSVTSDRGRYRGLLEGLLLLNDHQREADKYKHSPVFASALVCFAFF